jgi:hypothetical protein
MEEHEITTRREQLHELIDEMKELSQPRSDFALKHFVVGQHDLPARQRQQAILELQSMMFELANQYDEICLARLDIEEFEEALDKTEGRQKQRIQIQIDQKRRFIEGVEIGLTGRLRECDYLYAMLQHMPKVTAEQLEVEEEAYWAMRLSRQLLLAGRDPGGNLTAILQMLTDPGKPRPELAAEFVDALKLLGLSEGSIKMLNEEVSG